MRKNDAEGYRRSAHLARAQLDLPAACTALREAIRVAQPREQLSLLCELACFELGHARFGASAEALAQATLATLAQRNLHRASYREDLCQLWLAWGLYYHAAGQLTATHDALVKAERLAKPATTWMTKVLRARGTLSLAQGLREPAIAFFEGALENDDDGLHGTTHANLGICLLLEKRYRFAVTSLAHAQTLLVSEGNAPFAAQARMYQAWALLLDGKPERAISLLLGARTQLRHASDMRTLAVCEALAAAACVETAPGESHNLAASAQARAEEVDVPEITMACRVLRSARELCLGKNAQALDDAIAVVVQARTFLSDDVVLALRQIRRVLPDDVLFICDAFSMLRSRASSLDFRHHPTLWRIVVAMLDAKGQAVARETLLHAAWPGERINASAGENRLRVAVNKLRQLGCTWIESDRGHGYHIANTLLCGGHLSSEIVDAYYADN